MTCDNTIHNITLSPTNMEVIPILSVETTFLRILVMFDYFLPFFLLEDGLFFLGVPSEEGLLCIPVGGGPKEEIEDFLVLDPGSCGPLALLPKETGFSEILEWCGIPFLSIFVSEIGTLLLDFSFLP